MKTDVWYVTFTPAMPNAKQFQAIFHDHDSALAAVIDMFAALGNTKPTTAFQMHVPFYFADHEGRHFVLNLADYRIEMESAENAFRVISEQLGRKEYWERQYPENNKIGIGR